MFARRLLRRPNNSPALAQRSVLLHSLLACVTLAYGHVFAKL